MKIKQYSSGLRLVVNYKKDMDIVSFRIFVNVASESYEMLKSVNPLLNTTVS